MTKQELETSTATIQVRRNGRLLLLGLIGLCLLFVVAYVQRSGDKAAADAEIVALQAQIVQARYQQAVLRDELNNIALPNAIDVAARNDLGLIQRGDQLIVVLEPPAAPTPMATPVATLRANGDRTNWQRWLDLFFGPSE